MKLLRLYINLQSHFTSSLRYKSLPQHPFLGQPQLMLLPQCDRPRFTYTKIYKIKVLCNAVFVLLASKWKENTFLTNWQRAFPVFSLLLAASVVQRWRAGLWYPSSRSRWIFKGR